MTSKATTAQPPRQRSKAEKGAVRYLAALAAIVILATMLHSAPLAVLGVLVLLAVAVFRLRRAHRRHRSGGKVAARQRSKYQGTASWREIRAKMSPRAARKRTADTCPGLHPSEAHVVIGRATGILGRVAPPVADTWSGSRLVYAPPPPPKTGGTSPSAARPTGRGPLVSFPPGLRPAPDAQDGGHVLLGCRRTRPAAGILQPLRPVRPHLSRPAGTR